ncbi:hypothetical protein HNR01_004406 [Methylorubrum rhodesianum]|uniref:polysaccharide deacetylase family protein n=1 Tax=Methylorubrum rhodesianum TaxID=29427 RepID=UPI00160748A5|nr:polysaccharide deacetylase family protein [Methylorubrum rhodesianum]MBB5764759.1 hypothetical protein [Methylorubrum rhodesianum]
MGRDSISPLVSANSVKRARHAYFAILTYHRITDDIDHCDFYDLPWHRFQRQMALLSAWASLSPLIELNFDDGTSDHLRVGELLFKERFQAKFFIVTDWIGRPGFLTRPQLRALLGFGHTLGSHTVTHARLTTLTDAPLRAELDRSKKLLEDLTGSPVTAFAAPGGYLNHRVTQIAYDCGYNTVRSMDWGYNNSFIPRRALKTVPIFSSTTDKKFEQILLGEAKFTNFHLKQLAKKMLGEDFYIRLRNRVGSWSRLP